MISYLCRSSHTKKEPHCFYHPFPYSQVFVLLEARKIVQNHVGFNNHNSCKYSNVIFTEKRNISVRDLGTGDHEGWLFHRCRSGGAGAVWLRAWSVLKGTVFYGFKTQQSTKADIMISLPGFTASLADEVKSRKYAFKVYHTGKNKKTSLGLED